MVDKVRFAFTEVDPDLGALSTLPYLLFRFLNALGRDVEIVVKTKPKSRSHARTRIVAT